MYKILDMNIWSHYVTGDALYYQLFEVIDKPNNKATSTLWLYIYLLEDAFLKVGYTKSDKIRNINAAEKYRELVIKEDGAEFEEIYRTCSIPLIISIRNENIDLTPMEISRLAVEAVR